MLTRIYFTYDQHVTRERARYLAKALSQLAYDSKAYRDALVSTTTLDLLTALSCAGRHMTVAPTGGHNYKGPQGTDTI